jgi:hypothetical protein
MRHGRGGSFPRSVHAVGRQRRRQRDEPAAGHSRRTLRGQQQHCQDQQVVAPAQRDVQRLGDEADRHGEVDRRPVQVERIAQRHRQAHQRLVAAQQLQLLHQRRHRCFGGRGAEDDQELLLDEADDLEDVQPHDRRHRRPCTEDEDDAGQVEAQHQEAELRQRADAVLADGERHRAERAERRHAHDDAMTPNSAEPASSRKCTIALPCSPRRDRPRPNSTANSSTCRISPLAKASTTVPGMMFSRKPTTSWCGRLGIFGDRLAVEAGRIDVQPGARLEHVRDDQADEHRQRRHDLEVDDRLDADAADLLGIRQLGDADDDGDEDDRGDDHPHQLDEGLAERLHLHPSAAPRTTPIKTCIYSPLADFMFVAAIARGLSFPYLLARRYGRSPGI